MSAFFELLPRGGSYYEKPIVLQQRLIYIYHDTQSILHIRDSFHQGGDCQACQNQGVQAHKIRQD